MTVNRRISLDLVESGHQAVVELLDKEAPLTCEKLWKVLETPLEVKLLHTTQMGRTLEINLPQSHRLFDPESVPVENATTTPLIGDILWTYIPPARIRSLYEGAWNILLSYGPESVIRTSLGPQPANVWAQIVECDQAFYEECAKQWMGKAQVVRVARLP